MKKITRWENVDRVTSPQEVSRPEGIVVYCIIKSKIGSVYEKL